MIHCSIIIAFYNNINFLKLVLAGFDRQSDRNFEIIIADDGSKEDIVEEIKLLQSIKSYPINHLWHEDLGWRKTIILNKAVKAAQSDYLIFIDGDCIPHRHFVKEHLRNRELGKILSGRRLNLSKSISDALTTEMVKSGYLEKNIIRWLIKGFMKETSHAEKGLYLPLLRPILNIKNKDLLGCNFSIYTSDLCKINGFDERYLAPTVGEDTDIEFRAGLINIKIKSVRNLAIQYHLYHKVLSRENDNLKIFEETVRNKISFIPYGIEKDKP